MDFRHLRYFIAVAEEQNIGRAAARLHISQPPLTRQIQQLEAEIGVQLFNRTPRGMELTPAGELLLEEARNIRALVEQATERTQRAGQGKLGRLDIGIFGSGILDTIPRLLERFRESNPDVKLVLHSMSKHEQVEALRQKRISIGFSRMLSPLPDLSCETVSSESLLLAINEGHPLARETTVPFRSLAEHPLILFPTGSRPSFLDKVLSLCHQAGFEPQIAQEVGDTITAVALAARGLGASLVSESTEVLKLPGLTYRPLSGLPENARFDLGCIYRQEDDSPTLGEFLRIIREFRKEQA
ncbi:LysR family transcriptional regulator [Pseudomonas taiwanensis]|uniref:LysR family transcriptional regulator n=1 Tax=Pseudomonas TaxID=286 RepID=UPI0015BA2EE1|nr:MULTISPECIES: LysR family transcriptional regulator [Pseudomonas]MDH4564425.1 LysR family transcriptional regulator [Pseudomonas sp. BN411]MDH4656725.1 LysR family transcriptional regulator [Pseudomonas sp. BN606]MDH4874055.1 LysR family transcriptional regulator [Pseudomonas sp. BN515]NWL75687.1 LysR family transcriptional regulator [Pseudomonas taiwanensis]